MAGTQTIYLGVVPFDNTYSDVITFEDAYEREHYFKNTKAQGGLGFTALPLSRPLVEDEGVIVVTGNYYALMTWELQPNYLIVETEHQDSFVESHQLFAFILDIQPDSDNTIIITFEKDYWQSNMFNGVDNVIENSPVLDIRNAFVIREHKDRWQEVSGESNPIYKEFAPTNDYIDEELETGRFIQKDKTRLGVKDIRIGADVFTITPYILFSSQKYAQKDLAQLTAMTRIGGVVDAVRTFLFFDIQKNGGYFGLGRWYAGNMSLADVTLENLGTEISVQYPFSLERIDLDAILNDEDAWKYGKIPVESAISIDSEHVLGFYKMDINTLDLSIKRLVDTEGRVYYYIKTGLTSSTVRTHDNIYKTNGGDFKVFELLDVPKSMVEKVIVEEFDYRHHLNRFSPQLYPAKTPNQPYTHAVFLRVLTTLESGLLTEEFLKIIVGKYKTPPLYIKQNSVDNRQSLEVIYRTSMNLWLQAEMELIGFDRNDEYNFSLDYYDRVRYKLNDTPVLRTDAYLQYYTANRNQIQTEERIGTTRTAQGAIMAGVGTAIALSGVSTVGGIGMTLSGINMVTQAQNSKATAQAKQKDYINKADEIKSSQNSLVLDNISDAGEYQLIVQEPEKKFKERIAEHLHWFGHKTHKYKKPNLLTRYWFNYVKTADVKLNNRINAVDRLVLENIYLRGVTLWHYRTENKTQFANAFSKKYYYQNVELSLIDELKEA